MISVQDALQYIALQKKDFGNEVVSLLQSLNRILAREVTADRDFPPFDRATMDGIAIDSAAFQNGVRKFPIEGLQPAGHPQQRLANVENCIEIMTGAMLPIGANAVIRYEDIVIEDQVAHLHIEELTPLQNIHLQGTDQKAGNVLVEKGTLVTPAIIATMASVGLSSVAVRRLPKVAVCATGDELVAVTEQPQAHQIRQSNSYMLVAGLLKEGIYAENYHLPDEPGEMVRQLTSLIPKYDAVLFSGAVSKGKFDFLPQVLQQLGMETVFHSIAQKPGKPFLFGKFKNSTLIFGFPGNPVSTWVCYQLYFKTWLNGSLGKNSAVVNASLAKRITFKPALTNHVLVKISNLNGQLMATPIDTSTSGDMVNLMQAEGTVSLPANETDFEVGSVHEVKLF